MLPRVFSTRSALVLLVISNVLSWWYYFSAAQDHWVCVHALERCAPPSKPCPAAASSPPATSALQSSPADLPRSNPLEPEFVPRGGGDVILWESFDRDLLFSDERQYKISRMYGTHGRETSVVVKSALAHLVNTSGPAERRLVWGAMAADRTSRLKYVLDFHTKHEGQKGFALERVHLLRPIGAPEINPAYPSGRVLPTALSNSSVDSTTTLPQWHVDAMLTVVMTIKGRHSSLEGLLRTASSLNLAIARIALQFVVSVYNTPEEPHAADKVEQIFREHSKHMPFKIITGKGDFSRGRGLQAAIDGVPLDEHNRAQLLFICDVDLTFNAEFMQRCAYNAVPGQRVYFPVPFSMYRNKPVRISDETGHWRRYGLGMACVARSDIVRLGGYNTNIHGWGEEDVDLYERFVKRSGLEIMRVIDGGLIHLWHQKTCEPGLSRVQREHCVWSKMDYEGTKMQLALKLAKCNSSYVD